MSANSKVTHAFAELPMIGNGQKMFLAATRFQVGAYKAAMRYQIEMLNFLRHRFEQDVKLAEDLVASDELSDAFDAISNFFQNATTEYTAEASKMASIGSKLSSETARRMRKQADEMVEDLAARTVA